MASQKWYKVGEVGVDAGMVIVVDPCYLAEDAARPHPLRAESWEDFVKRIKEDTEATDLGGGQGVVVNTGYGDGSYPVEVRFNKENRVAEMRVRFIGRNI